MSTERILAEARMTLQAVQENENAWFVLYFIGAALLTAWLIYVARNWSWIPRRQQRRVFIERF